MKNAKRWMGWIAFLLLVAISFAGCDAKDEHVHSFGKWKTVNEESCTENGLRERKCDCGEVETQEISANGHELTAGICISCGYIDEVELLEFASMQFMTLTKRSDGTYTASVKGGVRSQVTALAIPGEYEGKKITAIADDGFANCEQLTVVALGEGITSVGSNAFKNCKSLEAVTLPESLTTIGDMVFTSCSSLKELQIPSGVTSIGTSVLRNTALETLTVDDNNSVYHSKDGCLIETEKKTVIAGTVNFVIPNDGSVTIIGDEAFYTASQLTSVTIPEGVTAIGSKAFWGCNQLETVYLPKSLTTIGVDALAGAGLISLQTFHFNGTSAQLNQIDPAEQWLPGDGRRYVLVTADGRRHPIHEHQATGEYIEELTCEGGGIEIYACVCGDTYEAHLEAPGHDYYAADCIRCGQKAPDGYHLEYELLPDGTWAVVGNGNRYRSDVLVIPGTYQGKPVTVVAKDAFNFRTSYEGLIIEEGVRIIEAGAFDDCYDMTFIQLPESLEIIGDGAFRGCYKLNDVVIPGGVMEIGPNAFHNCSALEKIVIPGNVKKVGGGAFATCRALKQVTIEEGVQEIGDEAFNGCNALTEMLVPNSVTYIGERAFASCDRLTQVTLSENLTTVEDGLFEWCEGLKSLTVPASVTEIKGSFPFYSSGIATLTIQNPEIRIAYEAFNGADAVKQIYFNGTIAQWEAVGDNFSSSFPVNCTVFCSDGSVKLSFGS